MKQLCCLLFGSRGACVRPIVICAGSRTPSVPAAAAASACAYAGILSGITESYYFSKR